MSDTLRQRPGTSDDYATLLALWERSVVASHDFLEEADRLFYKERIPQYFGQVSLILWYDQERLIGFSGTHGQDLEMLFLEPAAIGHGYGSAILQWLMNHADIQRIDVNRQNKRAKEFYLAHGFQIVGESPKDGWGKPYPLLHLQRSE